MSKENNIALDLGNNNTILVKKGSVRSSEPTIITLHKQGKTFRAVGKEAMEMEGKVNGQLKVVRPLKAGVIADLDAATKMLQAMVNKLYPGRSFLFGINKIVAGIPYATTEVERRALRVALGQFSSKKTWLIFEPLAAAIGMGIDIKEPEGKFLVDIGGGVTEIALISLSGIVTYQALKTGGDSFNEDIKTYLERRHLIAISDIMAERIKIQIGSASENEEVVPGEFQAIGKDLITGIPKCIDIDYKEIAGVLNPTIVRIEEAIIRTLEECPPELAGDIYGSGVYLTGGSALLHGLKERLEKTIKLNVHLAENPLLSVSQGIEKVMGNMEEYKGVVFK